MKAAGGISAQNICDDMDAKTDIVHYKGNEGALFARAHGARHRTYRTTLTRLIQLMCDRVGVQQPQRNGFRMLTTIILNWNRAHLLKGTIESYFATVGPQKELIVIDNASTDGSRDYLRRIESELDVKVLYLDENMGGEAYNLAIPLAHGDLIHLSENDQVFLSGWFDHVLESFAAHDDLGQLSLFNDVPTDDEAWEPKPSHLRFSRGKILYEAHANVGTSSILRAELFRDHGLKIENIEHGAFRFPHDGKLSADVKKAGYYVAWSDRYYARNVGHEIAEFETYQAYYKENYANKPWIGVDGWRARIDRQKALPKVPRSSIALPDRTAIPEKTAHAVNGTPARLWSMFDGFTAETEVLDFLYVLTRLIKPMQVIETGTWLGLSSCAIARGLISNGLGHLTTLETNIDAHAAAQANISEYNVSHVVSALLQSSMEFVPECQFDMALFDSDLALRVDEFRRFQPWMNKDALVMFHDTAPHHGVVIDGIKGLINEGVLTGIDLPTPRGIFIGKLTA